MSRTAVKEKPCTKCGESKLIEDFHLDSRRKDGRQSRCRTCQNEETLIRYYKNPSKKRERNLQKLYGISLEDYNNLRYSQDYKCGICRRHEEDFWYKLCVDHDHKTGSVRALLCTNCNTGLGVFNDDPKLLKKAMEYLVCHEPQ